MKVYDLEGKEYEKYSVDARECVEHMGWSFTAPEPEKNTTPKPEEKPKPSRRRLKRDSNN